MNKEVSEIRLFATETAILILLITNYSWWATLYIIVPLALSLLMRNQNG